MKRFFRSMLIAAAFILPATLSSAQEIGIRYGNNGGDNYALDGVFAFKSSRIHADVSFTSDFFGSGLGVDVLYDFFWRPLSEENLYWYMGLGATTYIDQDFDMGAAFEIGLEYRFAGAPIALGADYRPSLMLIGGNDFQWQRWGINVRFVFGNK